MDTFNLMKLALVTAHNIPYVEMRLFPAFCGSLVVPISFLILKEMGVSFYAAMFGAGFLLFGIYIIPSFLIYIWSLKLIKASHFIP